MGKRIGNQIEDFEIFSEIGSGGFATVYKAKCLKSGCDVAIKKILKKGKNKQHLKERVEQEIRIHSSLYHPSIVKFYTWFQDGTAVYLVLELCEGGSLKNFVECNGPLPEKEASYILKQITEGVLYLQIKHIIHRDLSSKNIMFTDETHVKVKIIDFGLAVELEHIDQEKTSILGTPNFMAPEMITKKKHNIKVDCWGLGCLLFILLVGKPPFDGKGCVEAMDKSAMAPLKIPDHISLEAKKLLYAFLKKQPNNRIHISRCLQYPFFKKYEQVCKRTELACHKNGDSGMGSLSNSTGLSARSAQRSTGICDSGMISLDSVGRQNPRMVACHLEKECVHSSGFSSSNCNSNSRCAGEQMNIVKICNSQADSQMWNCSSRLVVPPYPHHLVENIKMYACADSYFSGSNTMCTEVNNSNGCNMFKNPSCSHDRYCTTDACLHETICSCRQRPLFLKECGSNRFHTNEQEQIEFQKADVFTRRKDVPIEKSLSDIVPPLSSVRLAPKRHSTKNATISILSDGQVCLEFLKAKNNGIYVTRVCVISSDGMTICLYKPKNVKLSSKPPPKPRNPREVQYFAYENLPEAHWKKYQYAARFIDIIRSKTPKITIYGKNAKCIMMENANPDFEMHYYDGRQITQSGETIIFSDKNGISTPFADDDSPASQELLNEFDVMKKRCKELESHLEKLEENPEDIEESYFPVISGRRPTAVLETRDMNKENRTPQNCQASVDRAVNNIRSFSGLVDTPGFSPYEKLHSQGPSASPKPEDSAIGIRSFHDILPSLKGALKIKNNNVLAEYKDGLQMMSSLDGKIIKFYDLKSNKRIREPKLDPICLKRIQQDLKGILHQAMKEAKETAKT